MRILALLVPAFGRADPARRRWNPARGGLESRRGPVRSAPVAEWTGPLLTQNRLPGFFQWSAWEGEVPAPPPDQDVTSDQDVIPSVQLVETLKEDT
ncbi:hypothetical protein GCM10018779_67450 [Streptomyces griseocarneus]|nr:hypothetical protein GCM10018779_67450 [Streptomyces griseocarneus]